MTRLLRLAAITTTLGLLLLGCMSRDNNASKPGKVNPSNAAESDTMKRTLAALPGVLRVDGGYTRNIEDPGSVGLGITVRHGTSLEPLATAAIKAVWLSKLSPCAGVTVTVGTEDNPPTSITRDAHFDLSKDELTKLYGPRPTS